MEKDETIKILAMLNAYYGKGKADPRAMANAWHIVLQEYDFAVAQQAVVTFAKTDMRDYATFPSVGQIVAAIKDEMRMPNLIYGNAKAANPYHNLPERAKEMISDEDYTRLSADRQAFWDDANYDIFMRAINKPRVKELT